MMAFSQPSEGYGHNFADKEASWITFTVTPSLPGGTHVLFTVADPQTLLTSMKMLRAVLGDAIDQHIATNAAQLVTNSVSIGNDPNVDDYGGSNLGKHASGDGFLNINWDKVDKTATTPAITTTSLTTDAITVSVPYADVV
jgi:hypothetical protein